jgi:branched-chain amino acid transport system permease protein
MGVVGIPQVDSSGAFLAVTATLFLMVQMGADYVNDSFIGRHLRAVRESEAFAASVGIRVRSWRSATFAACAGLAGLSGALFAHQSGYVGSDAFTIRLSISFLIAAVIGGLGTRSGPLLGTFVLLLLAEFLAGIEKYSLMIYGGILLAVLLVFPQGIAGIFGWLAARHPWAKLRVEAPSSVSLPAAELPRLPLGVSLGIADVSKSYAGVKAVDGVSIRVASGTVHGLIGPNGAGKSTLINLIAGLYRCDGGEIDFGHARVTDEDTATRARLGLARTFQNLQLIQALPAIDNVVLGMPRCGSWTKDFMTWLSHRGHEQASRREALAIMRFLDIEAIANRLPGELSYGHRKLVELARAIAQKPSLLLLDEPIAGLNTVEARGIAEAIRRLRAGGATIVVVEHNMEFVMSICDAISVLDQGRLLVTGSPAVVKQDPRVIAAYLGVESVPNVDAAQTPLEAEAK